ncbi:MAG: EAL domain-containing protein [Deltaproteobacteria bacterium]|nr:EAL domain-containing protein [Deltaproteobacteria bacterium]
MAKEQQGSFARVWGRAQSGELGEANINISQVMQIINERLVRIVYQPIVDLKTRKIYGYEALARSLTPKFKGPEDLFATAVQERCVGELGRMLRALALDGCTEYPLFLNVNPNEFNQGFLVQPDDPVFWHELPIYMEITESVPLSHFALCSHVIGELRSKGVRIAIDDLGAGFSNLKYISDLEPDIVKVDRELVAGVDKNRRKFRLLHSIVSLCNHMGAAVVAEGIETTEELVAVCATGAQYGQGFLLAYPDTPLPKAEWPM